MDSGLRDHVVLVTGAAGGIGTACAEAFAAEGARLALHANSRIGAAHALARRVGVEAVAVQADLRCEPAVDALFDAVLERFGRIDAVVANAGTYPVEPVPIHAMDLARWRDTIDVNLTGTFLCARAYFRYLAASRPANASLVMIASTAAIFGEENHADYAASKAALAEGLTRTLKNEIVRLVPSGRVNTVSPGWTRTARVENALADTVKLGRVFQTRALREVARPEDIANAVVYLSSQKLAGHITGAHWCIAGGMEGRLLHDLD